MTVDEKLASILDIIQVDLANRGLARTPDDNLFSYCRTDYVEACKSIENCIAPKVEIVTGFYIPSSEPPSFETDGPLGAWFLAQALRHFGIEASLRAESAVLQAVEMQPIEGFRPTHRVAIERSGPAQDGKHYTMRGRELQEFLDPEFTTLFTTSLDVVTIGIGDGGNEIGMGKIPKSVVNANIPNGSRVHCQVATQYLIVAGVSNWGAYALAAGVAILRQQRWPEEWANSEFHRAILQDQVRRGPLVDGVTLQFSPTVDGLPWEEYYHVMHQLHAIVNG